LGSGTHAVKARTEFWGEFNLGRCSCIHTAKT
jgi:hypothetical protein